MKPLVHGDVVEFGIVILDGPGNYPIRALTGWATVRAAETYARTLTGIAGYRVVTLQRVAVP
ncbi:hypothetical protein [Frankia tisae]|uniref:hypothetical protein n=1 Tax=Frankia tisae TaxID=2950104 RepID=UPI0021C0CE66|nr:hypothetical protein [Frankia tisae]